MSVKLPRLTGLTDVTPGAKAATVFARFWDNFASEIEGALGSISETLGQIANILNGSVEFTNLNVNGTSVSALVVSVAGRTGVVTLTKADVGLPSVEDKSSATIRSEITAANIHDALTYTPVGTVNGHTGSSVTVTQGDVGLGAVENKSSATIRGELTAANVNAAISAAELVIGSTIRLGGFTTNADAPVVGYITVNDSTGTARKLAVIT